MVSAGRPAHGRAARRADRIVTPCRLGGWAALLSFAGPLLLGAGALEPPTTGGLVELEDLLRRLAVHRRLLVIGAHPDDEDQTLITLARRGLGAEVAYLSLTRGEGGQNLIGSELGVELGLLRSQELLAARQIDGGRQYFTRAYDFGYTRSLEETLRFWPRSELLEDVVRVVRKFRPQVIVSIFPPTARAGHGQHQAAGVMAQAAFEVSSSLASMEALAREGLPPWQPETLYRSAWFNPEAATLELSTGVVEPFSGRTYYQLAMASRSMHRSQDMGRLQELGPRQTRLSFVEGVPPEADRLFSGPGHQLSAIGALAGERRELVSAELTAAEFLLEETRRRLDPRRPAAVVAPLVGVLGHLRAARRASEGAAAELVDEKIGLAERAVAVAAGLSVDATSTVGRVVPGGELEVETTLYNAGPHPVAARSTLHSSAGWVGEEAEGSARLVHPGQLTTWTTKIHLPEEAQASRPYFLQDSERSSALGLRPPALYSWRTAPPELRGEPFGPPPLVARFDLEVAGESLVLEREVVHRSRDQAVGEVRRPLRAVPRLEVSVTPERVVWPLRRVTSPPLRVELRSNADSTLRGRLELRSPEGWPPGPERLFELAAGEAMSLELELKAPSGLQTGGYRIELLARLEGEDGVFGAAFPNVDHPHVRPVAVGRQAVVEVRSAELRLPALESVGYVRGASDRVPEALTALGLPIEMLTGAELEARTAAQLEPFNALIIGSRAYEADPRLQRANDTLLDYVRRGGLLLVQYQQYQFSRQALAPLALEILRPHGRVTDEEAPVRILDPKHRLWHRPHVLTSEDWSGWVQERGLYFAGSWDPGFVEMVEMADPDRPPERGGLLLARIGGGTYVYTGLAFFRQLPAGVPGAYRLFMNLLALAEAER